MLPICTCSPWHRLQANLKAISKTAQHWVRLCLSWIVRNVSLCPKMWNYNISTRFSPYCEWKNFLHHLGWLKHVETPTNQCDQRPINCRISQPSAIFPCSAPWGAGLCSHPSLYLRTPPTRIPLKLSRWMGFPQMWWFHRFWEIPIWWMSDIVFLYWRCANWRSRDRLGQWSSI